MSKERNITQAHFSGVRARQARYARVSPYYEDSVADYFFFAGFDGMPLAGAMEAYNAAVTLFADAIKTGTVPIPPAARLAAAIERRGTIQQAIALMAEEALSQRWWVCAEGAGAIQAITPPIHCGHPHLGSCDWRGPILPR